MAAVQSSWKPLGTGQISTGHFVRDGHVLLTTGTFGLMRHPTHVGGFMLWVSVAITFGDAAVLGVLVL